MVCMNVCNFCSLMSPNIPLAMSIDLVCGVMQWKTVKKGERVMNAKGDRALLDIRGNQIKAIGG
jgi:hypothetical protein